VDQPFHAPLAGVLRPLAYSVYDFEVLIVKYSEASYGRVFVIRLEDGDILHEQIEGFALDQGISAAILIAVGGADRDSRLVVGPENGRAETITPMEHVLGAVHEVVGTGTLFPDENGNPVLHMHLACGRQDKAVTGCVRRGVKVWHVMEVVVLELTDSTAVRRLDPTTGFELLEP
jgi:predicted DNA-binding protein with PD1-like motif